MTDTATPTATEGQSERRTPELAGTYEGDFPTANRNGFWQEQSKAIKAEPGKTFVYKNVSPTTASNLRKDYGFDAVTRTQDGVVTLHVRYDPERVDAIKAEVKARGEKRRQALAEAKANGKGQAPASKAQGQTAKASK